MAAFNDLGLFNIDVNKDISSGAMSWADLMKQVLAIKDLSDARAAIRSKLTTVAKDTKLKGNDWTVNEALVVRVDSAIRWYKRRELKEGVTLRKGVV